MKTILEEIKRDLDQARKDKDSKLLTILSTLYGESCRKNKVPADDEVIATIKRNIKNIDEFVSAIKGNVKWEDRLKNLEFEKKVLNDYLPKQMTEEELRNSIEEIVKSENITLSKKNIGSVMLGLKEKYGGTGKFCSKLASDIAREILNN